MKFQLQQSGAFEAELQHGKINISSNTEIGFRPVELLVSSIAGCSGGMLKTILGKRRIDFESIEIEAEIERNEKEAYKVTKVALHYIVYGKNLSLTKVQQSLDIAVKNCAIVQSVNNSIEIIETIEVRES